MRLKLQKISDPSAISGIVSAWAVTFVLIVLYILMATISSPAIATTNNSCQRQTLQQAISTARKALAEKKSKSTNKQDKTPSIIDVISAELAITAVPRYYDIVISDGQSNYMARVDEASGRLYHLTEPSEVQNKNISKLSRPLYGLAHADALEMIGNAINANRNGIATAIRLKHLFGPQPLYEVVLRMPPGNDEIVLIDGLTGEPVELENFE